MDDLQNTPLFDEIVLDEWDENRLTEIFSRMLDGGMSESELGTLQVLSRANPGRMSAIGVIEDTRMQELRNLWLEVRD